jgi:hypothetical protein
MLRIYSSGWEIKRRERVDYRRVQEFENGVTVGVLHIMKEYTCCLNPQLKRKGNLGEIVRVYT